MLSVLNLGRLGIPLDAGPVTSSDEQDLRRFAAGADWDYGGSPVVASTRDPPRAARSTALENVARPREVDTPVLPRLESEDPDPHSLWTPRTVSLKELQSRLRPDDLFLEYLLGERETLLFAITNRSIDVLKLGIGRRDLRGLITLARGTIAGPLGAEEDDGWRAPLRRLYRELILPAEAAGFLSKKRRLLVAPHGELHYVPFQALLDSRDTFLVEHYAVGYLPSASVWAVLPSPITDLAETSVLAVAPWEQGLQASGAEVRRIGKIYGERALVLRGDAATEDRFRAEVGAYDILHLATMGVLNRVNPLYSHVVLRPGDLEDGKLEVHEVFGLGLSGSLVVLSACETGLSSGALADVPSGDEWVGLVRAFLQAGAAGVVASLWQVDDEATEALMVSFYRQLAAGAASVDALAEAQRMMIRDPAMAHPYQWAAFVLTGSP